MKRENKKTIMFNKMMNVVKQYNFKLTENEVKNVVDILFNKRLIHYIVSREELKELVKGYKNVAELRKKMRKQGYRLEILTNGFEFMPYKEKGKKDEEKTEKF